MTRRTRLNPAATTQDFAQSPTLGAGVFRSVDAALSVGGSSVALQVQGDSTGNAVDEWVYLLSQWLGARHPNAHVKYKLWDDASQAYLAWSVLQAGTAGERYALFKGTGLTRSMYQKVANIPTITGDIDIRVRLAADAWSSGAAQTIVARYGTAGNRAWRLALGATGTLDFLWTTDGSTNIQKVSSATGFTNGAENWIRVTLDVDNGGGGYTWTAYKSTDNITWTQIGTSATATGGATSLFNASAQEYEIGGRGLTGELFAGKIFEVQIRDGIGGKIVNPQPIDSWMPRDPGAPYEAGSFGGSPTLYVLNGSHPGASMTYLADTTRHPLMIHPYAGSLVFQSCSYNDFDNIDAGYITDRAAWVAQTEARAVGCQTVLVTQAPMLAISGNGTNRVAAHGRRRQLLTTFGARKGLVVIDTYKRFLDYPGGFTGLIEPSDGIHPTASIGNGLRGEDVWLKAITDAWAQAS